jgi:hypothetical protein
MSIRPRRKAAQRKNLNEDLMFFEPTSYLPFNSPKELNRTASKSSTQNFASEDLKQSYVQQRPKKTNDIPQNHLQSRKKMSLREYLSAQIPSKKVFINSRGSAVYHDKDAKNYFKPYLIDRERKLTAIRKRRMLKEQMKQARDYLEKQQRAYYRQKMEMFTHQQTNPTRQHFAPDRIPQAFPNHPVQQKHREVPLEK